MLSHYGSEHYCPITLVRIYGNGIDEDDDGEDDDTADQSDASTTKTPPTSATDASLNNGTSIEGTGDLTQLTRFLETIKPIQPIPSSGRMNNITQAKPHFQNESQQYSGRKNLYVNK